MLRYKMLKTIYRSLYVLAFFIFTIFTASAVDYSLLEPLNSVKSYVVKSDQLGAYLADISQYLFMIIAVISAFYLIYGGIQYLTTDMSSSRLQGKETIKRVIIGLIFIFSIWTIFNAINPDLLRVVDFGGKLTIGAPGVTQGPGGNTAPQTAPIVGCTTPATVNGITVCSTIASNLTALLNAAAKDGFIFGGYGLRDSAKQIALRKQNCGTSDYAIYQMPSGQCNPATAIPGTSSHERGVAIDFTIGGATICYSASPNRATCTHPAYLWLMKNAGTYNFKNNTNEPWHWSDNGY